MTCDKYKFCNHHHELTEGHKTITLDGEKIVANKIAIPLLKELNKLGLKTRTHHVDKTGGFFSILLDNAQIEVRKVFEKDSTRTKYNGKYEVLIIWRN